MIGLPSALFAKLIAAIKVGSGDVIQFNSFLMPRLKALSAYDNFPRCASQAWEAEKKK